MRLADAARAQPVGAVRHVQAAGCVEGQARRLVELGRERRAAVAGEPRCAQPRDRDELTGGGRGGPEQQGRHRDQRRYHDGREHDGRASIYTARPVVRADLRLRPLERVVGPAHREGPERLGDPLERHGPFSHRRCAGRT